MFWRSQNSALLWSKFKKFVHVWPLKWQVWNIFSLLIGKGLWEWIWLSINFIQVWETSVSPYIGKSSVIWFSICCSKLLPKNEMKQSGRRFQSYDCGISIKQTLSEFWILWMTWLFESEPHWILVQNQYYTSLKTVLSHLVQWWCDSDDKF